MTGSAGRLDNFTDAAFAFALSLLVIGRGQAPTDYAELKAAMADLPAFAIGFAILGMFWYGHVRWRAHRGEGGALSVLLTFVLVFLVMVYVQPLQAMSASLSTYLGGSGTRFTGDLGGMFAIYGAGFTGMAAVMAALFADAQRQPGASPPIRTSARGETIIWLILTATGLVSMLLSLVRATAPLAPFVYSTLPLTIGLFAWRYPWAVRDEASETAPAE
ncbi:MAG TPA: TMEM175 family protein [Allosphingosinicella sp.]|nr:TMEM175 family protein [Allosphingosinicella sp.]